MLYSIPFINNNFIVKTKSATPQNLIILARFRGLDIANKLAR